MAYPLLFSPITLNGLTLKNRIAYPSLGVMFSHDSKLNDRYYAFYQEIARGGAGMVTVGPVGVDFIGAGLVPLSLAHDDAIPAFTKAAEKIRRAGASPWIQLFHAGAYSHPFLINNEQPMAPSAVFSNYSKTLPRKMGLEDIKAVKAAFVMAAARAREAGFQGVELIGSAGYLISQFLSPVTNRRRDEYGGCFENRLRFPRELIQGVRGALGDDFPLGVRMAGADFVPGSNDETQMPRIARAYESAGADVLNVTGGWHESRIPQLPMELPRGGFSFLAMNIRGAVSIPVMASNRIATPDQAEAILSNGQADMVNLGRVLIADPQWPAKAKAGRSQEIRPCVACSQGCTDELFNGRPVSCIGNARAGLEFERPIPKTSHPQYIMVAGAGPGGLEAALTAARAGHRVEVYERQGDLGGQLRLAGAPPHKQEFLEFIRYYGAMVEKYGIPLFLNHPVTPEFLKEKQPDHLIIAQGAAPLTPSIPGIKGNPSVVSAWEVLAANPFLGKEVAILGGGAVGLETAHFVAQKGTLSPDMLHFLFTHKALEPERLRHYMAHGTCRVTVFELQDRMGAEVGKSTRWILMDHLRRHGVNLKTQARVTRVADNYLVHESPEGGEKTHPFDTLITALGSRSVNTLESPARKLGIPFTLVGDSRAPGKINHAIHGGFLAVAALG